jgi:hypothetical protein
VFLFRDGARLFANAQGECNLSDQARRERLIHGRFRDPPSWHTSCINEFDRLDGVSGLSLFGF